MTFHAWLGGLLARKDDTGALQFSRREVEDLVGAIVLTTGFEPGALPPRVARALEGLIRRAALDPREPLKERTARLERYFEQHPLPDALLIDFRQGLRGEIAEKGGASREAAAFAAFLDEVEVHRARREGEARPEGTRPGGALGFFLARGDTSP